MVLISLAKPEIESRSRSHLPSRSLVRTCCFHSMPPKQKGHNARGRTKIFRNAVETVRIGVGHSTIGSVSLQLAAGIPTTSRTSDIGEEPSAFHMELNQQLLSHSSKDFTRFRWEVLEMCETRRIVLLHHREIAEALLERLLDRSSSVVSSTEKGKSERGLTSEGYDAFLRLTIAFARDLQSKFLIYFEVFQQAVHAGLFDGKGNVIASAERLQLLYSVQAVWCREMLPFWEDDAYFRLVQRIICLYVQQLRDSKEYVRRLSAELLAFLCRLCRKKLVLLVVREAGKAIAMDFIKSKLEIRSVETSVVSSSVEEDEEDEEESEAEAHEEMKSLDRATREWQSAVRLQRFLKEILPFHPITDGLTFYAADLFRGIQGTLNTSMEFFYAYLLQSFCLSSEQAEESPEADAAGPLSSPYVIAEDLREAGLLLKSAEEEMIGSLLRETGSLVLRQALGMVLVETRKQSLSGKALTDAGESSEGEADTLHLADRPSHRLLSIVVELLEPNEYHLHLLDTLLTTGNHFIWRDRLEDHTLTRVAEMLHSRIKVLRKTLSSGEGQASTETEGLAFCSAVLELVVALCVSPYVTGEMDYGKLQSGRMTRPLELQQLFLSLARETISFLTSLAFHTSESCSPASDAAQVALLSFAQDILAKNYCFCLAEERRHNEDQFNQRQADNEENFSEEQSAKKGISVKSFLTPLALTLLRHICMVWWPAAGSSIHYLQRTDAQFETWVFHRRLVERGVLMLRVLSDTTLHCKSTPLQQVLRLKPVAPKSPSRQKSETTSASEGSPLPRIVQNLLLDLAKWFSSLKTETEIQRSSERKSSSGFVEMKNTTAAELLVCVLPLSESFLSAQLEDEQLKEWKDALREIQKHTLLEEVHRTSYLVHAHVSLSLLRLSVVSKNHSEESSAGNRFHSHTDSVLHLENTIELLYKAFEEAMSRSTGTSSHRSHSFEMDSLPASDTERSQLYRSAEIMLEALSVAFHVEQKHRHSESEKRRFDAGTLLKASLSDVAQEQLVSILLDSLAAPLQSLRVAALRLLQILCRPTLSSASERLAGISAVEPFVFTALLSAEQYNPLSHSGNMDGLQSALLPVVSAVERGKIGDIFTKVILGRAMIGLLHVKFAEAWPTANKVLISLSKSEYLGDTLGSHSSAMHEVVPFWDSVVRRYARLLVIGEASVPGERVGEPEWIPTAEHDHWKAVNAQMDSALRKFRLYKIRLTDQQRHEKGEMISRAFSSSVYRSSRYSVIDIPSKDGEVLSWDLHWRNVHLSSAAARSAVFGGSTDTATVAKTFLLGLSGMVQHINRASDPRLRLAEELTQEVSSIYHHDHPSGLPLSVRRIDERVELALQVCSAGPSLALSKSDSQLQSRAAALSSLCLSFLADGNSRLQRAAMENLRRLKVEPFVSHHARLLPFADNMKSLFGFLSTFHIETDILEAERASFISAVLIIALPKLITKVSKEKRRDQAVLQRRVLGFLQHLPSHTEALQTVVVQLVQRLVLTKPEQLEPFDLKELNFLMLWSEKVQRSERQSGRFIEKLLKKLNAALQLMEAVINAVGSTFGECVKISIALAVQAYLVACKQNLTTPVMEQREVSDGKRGQEDRLLQLLHSKSFASLSSHVRRNAVQVVALLTEQFPIEVMDVLQQQSTGEASIRDTPFGQYIAQLSFNSKGSTRDSERSTVGRSATKGYTTPVLRLIRAWLLGPSLLPLIPTFSTEVIAALQQVFAARSRHEAASDSPLRPKKIYKAQTKDIYEALSCVTDILRLADEEVAPWVAANGMLETTAARKGNCKGGKTLGQLFVVPYIGNIFESIYRLILCGAEDDNSASSATVSKTVMSFPPQLWRELFHTVTALLNVMRDSTTNNSMLQGSHRLDEMPEMQSKLLEIAIRFTSHPVCVKDPTMLLIALDELSDLIKAPDALDLARHYYPIIRLFNALPIPAARRKLCEIFETAMKRLPVYQTPASKQLDALARAVNCLNSFGEDNTALDRYDFDLRFHTFNSLKKFFLNDGNYGALSGHKQQDPDMEVLGKTAVRQERDYSGAFDVRIPVDKCSYPTLVEDGFVVLAANTMFFLRDSESTIRTFARHLLYAMIQYASRAKAEDYRNNVLEGVIRRIVLPSLRRGVVARDVHIRAEHISSFGALGKFFSGAFPSFAVLHSPNTEENFFANVCHVQPKARLNALAVLRRKADQVQVRDLLRVFIPFLMSAVKDFAQGKRDMENLTEGKAKGYCDAVLMTISSIAQHLPWMAYYRVLSLLLESASSNPDYRLPMLRGVVQVLDHFTFLDEGKVFRKQDMAPVVQGDEEKLDGEVVEEASGGEPTLLPEMESTPCEFGYYSARIVHALERDILPKLLEFICDSKTRRGLGIQDHLTSQHSVSAIRSEEEKKSTSATKNSIIQLPVAVAVTKIVKKLPENRCNEYLDVMLDEVIAKLRTKNDKQRDSARRILGVMLQETGPAKLQYVIKKLKGHLVHGYQLHVLGYTMVTLLYQLYEPNHSLLEENHDHRHSKASGTSGASAPSSEDVIQEALNLIQSSDNSSEREKKRFRTDDGGTSATVEEEHLVSRAEEELIRQLIPSSTRFDPEFGVACLTDVLDELLLIFLDDYLGEIGHQKEQIELMSKMVEVKRNRSVQGFNLLARHAKADVMMQGFIQRVSWVLTPPAESEAMALASMSSGSAHVRTLIKAEIQRKYTTVGKTSGADIVFLQKVRSLSLSVARNFLVNPTLEVQHALEQVHRLLSKHNQVREDRIRAFEAKDGTRRIRSNDPLLLRATSRLSMKDQADKNFLVASEPERVDADFSAHTVLTTQQKQKLKVYKGRYAKELQQASKDFYREDATTAVVLDTLDEFLLRLLLSMLRKVLGIGRDKKRRSVVELDLLRRHRDRQPGEAATEERGEDPGPEGIPAIVEDELNPNKIHEEEDDLEDFAAAASENLTAGREDSLKRSKNDVANILSDLNSAFTREHRGLLQSLLLVVLTTLEGEGSDAVVAHALDSVLALVSLRPPLDVTAQNDRLLETVSMYFERGGPIKQRALRVCAGIIAHQRFTLSTEEARRMVLLIRGEVIERSEFLPMALSLLYSILGKHFELVEIYDLIDLLTELLVHLSGKRFIRMRSILCVVRFLTEYRLTPAKFRSHIDLICRNLDFPEMGGRLALLDLLDSLIVRLPTVVLREEAPVMLLPLAAMISHGEFSQERKHAGEVLQTLMKSAGVDVLAPTLLEWLQPIKDRPMRTMAAQATALCMDALRTSVYVGDEESVSALEGSMMWCVPSLLEACQYEPKKLVASGAGKESQRKKGWSLIFYALRALESIAMAVPQRLYVTAAPVLISLLTQRRMLHPHPWVRGVSFRLLNHYCYTFVESKSRYLHDSIPVCQEADEGRRESDMEPLLPLVLHTAQPASLLISQSAALLKQLLTLVGESDVLKEKHNANRAIDAPSRSDMLKLMLYLVKMLQQCSIASLTCEKRQLQSSREFIQKQFQGLHRHITAIASPALQHGSVENYVVRTATLSQFFGGYVGMLPRGGGTVRHPSYLASCCWLLKDGSRILELAQEVMAPLLSMALGARELSYRLADVAFQSLKVVQQQLEDRRPLLQGDSDASLRGGKRRREGESELDNVLALLVEKETATRQEQRVRGIRREVRKAQRQSQRQKDVPSPSGGKKRSRYEV